MWNDVSGREIRDVDVFGRDHDDGRVDVERYGGSKVTTDLRERLNFVDIHEASSKVPFVRLLIVSVFLFPPLQSLSSLISSLKKKVVIDGFLDEVSQKELK